MLFQSHQAEIVIVKRVIQGRNNVTRVRVEPRSFDQGRRKNDAFTFLATLPTKIMGTFHIRIVVVDLPINHTHLLIMDKIMLYKLYVPEDGSTNLAANLLLF